MTTQAMFLSLFIKVAASVFVCVITTSVVSAHTVVVVSVHNPVDTLTQSQVADIFLARTNTFPNGKDAVPIDQIDTAPARDLFYRDISGKSPAQLKAYWSTLIFTGRGDPPRQVRDATAVKKVLNDTLTAVGYLDDSALDSSVKVVLVLP